MVGTLVVILVNLAVLFGFFFFFRGRIDRALQSENILHDIRAEVDQMIIELNETTERNIGLVEDQLERLSTRIGEADRRIVVLKKESDRGRPPDTVYTRLRPVVAVKAEEKDSKQAERRPQRPVEKPPEKKNIREQVLELYRSGLDAREIASKLGKTLGEVELIITLGTNRA